MNELDPIPQFETRVQIKDAKIIVSSASLLKKLNTFWNSYMVITLDKEVNLVCDGDLLLIKDVIVKDRYQTSLYITPPLGCDGKFDVRVTFRRIERLIKFL